MYFCVSKILKYVFDVDSAETFDLPSAVVSCGCWHWRKASFLIFVNKERMRSNKQFPCTVSGSGSWLCNSFASVIS